MTNSTISYYNSIRMPSAVTLFNRKITRMNRLYHEIALSYGFSDSYFWILYALFSEGGSCLLRDCVSFTGLPKQTVNSALREMESDGVARRSTDASGRKTVDLTEKGRAMAASTAGSVFCFEEEIFSAFGEKRSEEYLDTTEEYIRALEEKINGRKK